MAVFKTPAQLSIIPDPYIDWLTSWTGFHELKYVSVLHVSTTCKVKAFFNFKARTWNLTVARVHHGYFDGQSWSGLFTATFWSMLDIHCVNVWNQTASKALDIFHHTDCICYTSFFHNLNKKKNIILVNYIYAFSKLRNQVLLKVGKKPCQPVCCCCINVQN